jgi:hypothetical protein
VLADPKRTHEKLAELEARIKDAKRAEHRAGTVAERLSIEAARERQELDERRDQLAKRARDLTSREAAVDVYERKIARDKIMNYAGVVGGITREDVSDGRKGAEVPRPVVANVVARRERLLSR